MAFVTLGEALEAALVSMMNEVGDGDGCNRPDAVIFPKGTGTDEGAGQVAIREVIPTQRADEGHAPASPANGRGRPVHSQAPPQRRTGRPMLLVIMCSGHSGLAKAPNTNSAAAL